MNYALLRSDPDEVFRFIWENAPVFGIDRRYRLRVDSVRPSMRVGPNGLVVPEVVADYVQSPRADGGRARRAKASRSRPAVKPDDRAAGLGRRRARVRPVRPRQAPPGQARSTTGRGRRNESTTWPSRAYSTRKGRLGFTLSMPRGQRFAAMHVADSHAGEDW